MIATISTFFDFTAEELWNKIIDPKSLQFVAAPLLIFKPLVNSHLDAKWELNKIYELKLYFCYFIPLGSHKIQLVKIDKTNNIIISNESGTLSPVWNHTITFKNERNKLKYTDQIEIKAGRRSFFIWLFAHFFYRHRQRRWKKLMLKTI